MSLQEFFQKQAMDESLAPKRGEIGGEGGDSPPTKLRGGDAPLQNKGSGKGKASSSNGKGKAGGRGGRRDRGNEQGQGTAGSQDPTPSLVTAMARLLLRHDEQLVALTSEVTFISYARTDEHTVLPQLFSELRQIQSSRSLTPPRQVLTVRFFRELKDRLLAVSKDRGMQEKLMEEGIVNSEGEFPFYEWSTTEQRLTETLEEPLNTSQVVSGLGDIRARLSTDPDHARMFKTSRPLSANMTGGPVRLQIQFSMKPASAELIDSLQALVGSSAFALINCDFQRQGTQVSPLVRQIRELMT